MVLYRILDKVDRWIKVDMPYRERIVLLRIKWCIELLRRRGDNSQCAL